MTDAANSGAIYRQSTAGQAFLDAMHNFYARLSQNAMRLFRAFLESELEFEDVYSDDHYYQLEDGSFDGACFPLPVIEVTDICDIFINDGSIDFYVFLTEMLPPEKLEQYNVREAILIEEANTMCLFRMSFDEESDTVVGFAEELKRLRDKSHIKEKSL